MWDINTATCLSSLSGHTSVIYAVSLSADATTVVSGSYDATVRVWDISAAAATSPTGGQAVCPCIATLRGHVRAVRAVTISLDRKMVVSGGDDKTVCVRDKNIP